MLSNDDSSGPSCSSKYLAPGMSAAPPTFPAETTLHQDPTDLVQPCTKFSIRDYIFSLRREGIKRSWPFHQRSLKLCLEFGVKDLLPPFEPPDLIRSKSFYTCIDVEQSAACSEVEASDGLVKARDLGLSNINKTDTNFRSCQSVDELPGPSHKTPPEDRKFAVIQGKNTNKVGHTDKVVQRQADAPSCRSKNLGSSCESSVKKCKLSVKLGSVTNIRRTKDLVSNSSSVLDPMASKLCPVCKLFASTSNTTLNAHIDQCLSVESHTELLEIEETVFLKPTVKPRKKKLMVDIYKTALPYTLEDLDRRNGTNWAIELDMPTANKEVCTKNRSRQVVAFEPRDGERDLDVYVDSNGIKIRILSKSSDATSVLRGELSSREAAKHETGKSKTLLKSKTSKHKKFKLHGKKYNGLNRVNSQVQACPDGDVHDDICEEPAMDVRIPTESTGLGCSETTGQWMCSKRSDLAKICGVMPKVPRSAAALAKRRIKEIGRREAYKPDNYDAVRVSTLGKSSEVKSTAGLRNDPNMVVSAPKMFRKHRSLLRTRRREFSPSISGLVRAYGGDHKPDHRHVSTKFRVHEGEEPATEVQYASASSNAHEDYCSEISTNSFSPEYSKTDDAIVGKEYSVVMEDSEQLALDAHVSNVVANSEMDEWQVDPASTKESSSCTNNKRHGAPPDNSSIASNREDSNQDHGLAFDRDSSGSHISTSSTESAPIALKDSRIRGSKTAPSTVSVRTVEERMSGSSNQETKSMPLPSKGGQLPNEKSFCCSCQANISRESQLQHENATARSVTFARKQVPQLHIGLRTSSSFSTYRSTSTNANPYLDSHDQQLPAKVSAESTISFPSYMTGCIRPSLQTQLPSPSSPMLRLMGKNLMVMNNEESGHTQAPSSDYMLRRDRMAPVGFMPPDYQHTDSAFINKAPSFVSHQFHLPNVQNGNFFGPPLHRGSMVQYNQHSLQKPYRNLDPVMHHPTYMMKDVTMMNDSPECRSEGQVSVVLPTASYPTSISVRSTMAPRPFYYLPPSSQILPRESVVGSMPVFTNASPMVGVGSPSQRNQVTYSQSSLLQSPEGCINPPVYYSRYFR